MLRGSRLEDHQLRRLTSRLELLRQADREHVVSGSKVHAYNALPPVQLHEIATFERKHTVLVVTGSRAGEIWSDSTAADCPVTKTSDSWDADAEAP